MALISDVGAVRASSDEEDENDTVLEVEERAWNKMHQGLVQDGYREGLSHGQELTTQTGFNEGYATAATTAFQLAHYRGLMLGLMSYLETTGGTGDTEDTQAATLDKMQQVIERVSALEKKIAGSKSTAAGNPTDQPESSTHSKYSGEMDMQPAADVEKDVGNCAPLGDSYAKQFYVKQLEDIKSQCRTIQQQLGLPPDLSVNLKS